MFGIYEVETLVGLLALVVFLVRAFFRFKSRSYRKSAERARGRVGYTEAESSADPVGRAGADLGRAGDPSLRSDGPREEFDLRADSPTHGRQDRWKRPVADSTKSPGRVTDSLDPSGGGLPSEETDSRGFNPYGIHHETATLYGPDGYDKHGYDREGYDRKGYDFQGYNRRGSRRRD